MALHEMSEDAPKEKKRVEKARERRLGTQRRQIERRTVRREKRYRNSPRGKAFQKLVRADYGMFSSLLKTDFSRYQAAVQSLADKLSDFGRAISKAPASARIGRVIRGVEQEEKAALTVISPKRNFKI